MNNTILILDYLNSLFPNPKCELIYNNDYEFLISVMLSAQTTDKRVNLVTKVLFEKYNTLEKLMNANVLDIENIIKSLGNYKKKSIAIIDISNILYNKFNGIVPNRRRDLESLPMVGRKTTNLVLCQIYNIPNIPVDTHVERVSKRLGLVKYSKNVLDVEKNLKRKIPIDCWNKFHHQMVLFGRYYCTAKNPKCDNCGLKSICKENKN